jgi:hypothetical protein
MIDASGNSESLALRLLPFAAMAVGLAMVGWFAWMTLSASYGPVGFFLAPGGPLAVGGAAIAGRRSKLMIKEVLFLGLGCSAVGGLANAGAMAVLPGLDPFAVQAAGQVAGTVTEVSAAYIAGMLMRRGARARRNEEISETFR